MSIYEKWIQIGSLKIHYFMAGEGDKNVVLLHGGGTNSAMLSWKYIIKPISQTHKVYAPDWPSYGESSTYKGKYTCDSLISCLSQLMDAWQLQKAHLVGLSMGGSAALGYALNFPDRVDKVILASSYGLQKRAPLHRLSYVLLHTPFFNRMIWACLRRSHFVIRYCLRKIIKDPRVVSEELVNDVFEIAQRPCIEKAFFSWLCNEVLWGGMRTCYVSRFHEVQSKILILHGDCDPLIPLSRARQASLRIPNARLHIFQNCGHWLTIEKPDEFNNVLTSFLNNKGDY